MQPHSPLYLDHQATTPMDDRVLDAMIPFMREEFGNPHSNDHILGWRASQAVDSSIAQIATLLGADSDEIVFTSGATEANNLAILGTARGSHSKSRSRILVSAIEHKCVLSAARALTTREGFKVELIPVDSDGQVNLDHLSRSMDDDVLLVSVMAVNNEIGTLEPIKEVSALTRKFGALFHSDCAQAPCIMDLQDLPNYVDIISLSAHKIYGPKGIGAAFIRREIQPSIEPIIYGGGQQRGLRSGTLPTALCVGFGSAAELAFSNWESDSDRVGRYRDRFLNGLISLDISTQLNGPKTSQRHAGNANVRFKGIEASELLGMLQPNLAASTGAACSSGIPEPSHVLRAIGLSAEQAESSIRFSFGRNTSEQDVDLAVHLIGEAISNILKTRQS